MSIEPLHQSSTYFFQIFFCFHFDSIKRYVPLGSHQRNDTTIIAVSNTSLHNVITSYSICKKMNFAIFIRAFRDQICSNPQLVLPPLSFSIPPILIKTKTLIIRREFRVRKINVLLSTFSQDLIEILWLPLRSKCLH